MMLPLSHTRGHFPALVRFARGTKIKKRLHTGLWIRRKTGIAGLGRFWYHPTADSATLPKLSWLWLWPYCSSVLQWKYLSLAPPFSIGQLYNGLGLQVQESRPFWSLSAMIGYQSFWFSQLNDYSQPRSQGRVGEELKNKFGSFLGIRHFISRQFSFPFLETGANVRLRNLQGNIETCLYVLV